ncbi:MAG: MFS transporter [Chloroflexi bacterium]|nr:MFS transporter [Chloroflexota bacterium]
METQRRNPWLGLLFICISTLIISLDNTVLNVALPSIALGLDASASELQWIVDSYILVFAALLLTMGSVGDRIGRKRILQFGIVWFAVFSLMAALSESVEMLIAARALLGFGGAMILPATLSLITASFREPKQRTIAIAIWSAVFGLGLGLGPLVSGFLLEYYEWNSVFFINLPVAAVALVGGYFLLGESKDEKAPSPDLQGVGLSIVGLFALVYGIIEAGVRGWTDGSVLVAFAIAAVTLTAFVWWELRAPNAMLPMFLFKNMSFTGASIAISLMMFSILGAMFFLTQFFQSVQSYSPLETGVRMFPMFFVFMVAAGNAGQISNRLNIKVVVGIGFLIATAGMLFLALVAEVDSSYWILLPGMLAMGVGMGLAMTPTTDSIMGSVPVHKAGVGSAMNDTTREVGGAMGIAVLGTLMNHRYLQEVTNLKAIVPPEVYEVIQSSIQGAHGVAAAFGGETGQAIVNSANQAFVSGMTNAMLIGAGIMFASSLLTLAILPAETHCIEPECLEEEQERARASALPAPAGD